MSDMDVCEFCDELGGSTEGKALWPKLVEGRSRILMENEDFVAMASIGPIGPGHSLILPRQHCLSMSSVSNQRALQSFRWELEDRLCLLYGKSILMFEHGVAEDSGCTPCTVSHAHWHFVPSDLPVEEMLAFGLTWEAVREPINQTGVEYLLVGSKDQFWVGRTDGPIPSQVLRKTFVEKSRIKSIWDWHLHYNTEMVLETLTKFGK